MSVKTKSRDIENVRNVNVGFGAVTGKENDVGSLSWQTFNERCKGYVQNHGTWYLRYGDKLRKIQNAFIVTYVVLLCTFENTKGIES